MRRSSDEPRGRVGADSECMMHERLGERLTAKVLTRRWNVRVQHALYHKEGTWYNNLRRFPGALLCPDGYVIFNTEDEYRQCPYVSIGKETNVRPDISSIPGYVRMKRV